MRLRCEEVSWVFVGVMSSNRTGIWLGGIEDVVGCNGRHSGRLLMFESLFEWLSMSVSRLDLQRSTVLGRQHVAVSLLLLHRSSSKCHLSPQQYRDSQRDAFQRRYSSHTTRSTRSDCYTMSVSLLLKHPMPTLSRQRHLPPKQCHDDHSMLARISP